MKLFVLFFLLTLLTQTSFAARKVYLKATFQNSLMKICRFYAYRADITKRNEDGSIIREVKKIPYSGRTLRRMIYRSRQEPLFPAATMCDGGTTKLWGYLRQERVTLVKNLDCLEGSKIRRGTSSQKLKEIAQRYCGIYLNF